MDWYANYYKTPDGRLGGETKSFKPEVCWQLPRKGFGYVVYSPDDLDNAGRKRLGEKLLNDKHGYDQIGTKETVEAMLRIAREWNKLYPDKTLEYGDISRPGGINTPDHATHNNGKAFDMRLLRKGKSDGAGFTYNAAAYSKEFTKKFILFVVKLYPGTEFYFNDPAIEKDDPDTSKLVGKRGGHENHLHVMFPGGKE